MSDGSSTGLMSQQEVHIMSWKERERGRGRRKKGEREGERERERLVEFHSLLGAHSNNPMKSLSRVMMPLGTKWNLGETRAHGVARLGT